MSNNFVRGSQTTLHFIRMFKQSIKMIILSYIILFIGFFSYFIYVKAHPYPFSPVIHINYIKAKSSLIGSSKKHIEFQDEHKNNISLLPSEYVNFYRSSIIPYISSVSKDAYKNSSKKSLLIILCFISFNIIRGRLLKSSQFLRGITLVKPYQLKIKIHIHNLKKLSFNNFKLAGIPYPNHSEHQHTLITGGSGTGKTQTMLNLIEQIRKKGEKVIIYDRMGSFTRKFYDPNKDFIFNPLDSRGVDWDLFSEIQRDSDINMISSSLIPDAKNTDPFWSNSARIIFTKVCERLKREGEGNNRNLVNKLLNSKTSELMKYLEGTSASALVDSDAEKTAASIRAVLNSYINSIEIAAHDTKSSEFFSVRKWVNSEQEDSILFLTSRSDQHETLKPLISLITELAINEILIRDQEKSKRIWFFLDELPSLQKLASLETGLAQIRQYGGAMILSVQLMSQLKEVYGFDLAETISGLCRNRLFYSTPDEKTASWCAANLGKRENLHYKEGISYGSHEMRDGVSIHQTKELETIVLPSEIMNLPSLNAFIKMSEGMPVARTVTKYKDYKDVAEKFVEKVRNIIINKPKRDKAKKGNNSPKRKKIIVE